MIVEDAVILAAGMGTRLGESGKMKPKGFIELSEGKHIIGESVEKLLSAGIKKIIIGTGHLSEYYENLGKEFSAIKCVYNSDYSISGSMETLYQAQSEIEKDFLLLESDLIYEKRGLTELLADKRKDLILASELTEAGDEVFIETDCEDKLVALSKDQSELRELSSELVGISKISFQLYQKMNATYQRMSSSNRKIEYEHVFAKLAESNDIFVLKMTDFPWCEIDDSNHMRNAISNVYPKITQKEKSYV